MSVAPEAEFSNRTLGEIATALPGASAVFRSFKLDFCCGGNKTLAAAAGEKGLAVDQVQILLRELETKPKQQIPQDPGSLIDHILSRYHEVHRRELPELIRLARRVEAVHRDHPAVPAGLAHKLEEILHELESHMMKEEHVLFPMMKAGGHPMIDQPITMMRHDHDDHGAHLRELERLACDFVPPEQACNTWRALYNGLRKFTDDIMEHIHLENNVLFPQFAAARAVN